MRRVFNSVLCVSVALLAMISVTSDCVLGAPKDVKKNTEVKKSVEPTEQDLLLEEGGENAGREGECCKCDKDWASGLFFTAGIGGSSRESQLHIEKETVYLEPNYTGRANVMVNNLVNAPNNYTLVSQGNGSAVLTHGWDIKGNKKSGINPELEIGVRVSKCNGTWYIGCGLEGIIKLKKTKAVDHVLPTGKTVPVEITSSAMRERLYLMIGGVLCDDLFGKPILAVLRFGLGFDSIHVKPQDKYRVVESSVKRPNSPYFCLAINFPISCRTTFEIKADLTGGIHGRTKLEEVITTGFRSEPEGTVKRKWATGLGIVLVQKLS
jgi:hypothetical protein